MSPPPSEPSRDGFKTQVTEVVRGARDKNFKSLRTNL